MRNIVLLLLVAFLPFGAVAQKRKNYKPIVKKLNKMLKDAEEFSWMYEPGFKIVQPYAVKNDTLSVTIRGIYNEVPVTHKYEAPLADVYDYVHDLYCVLSFKSKSVKISELQGKEWKVIIEQEYFHLGKPKDSKDHSWGPHFRRLLNALYPLANEYETLD